MHKPNFNPTPRELRLFSLVLLIPAAVLHFYFHCSIWAVILAGYTGICLVVPTVARPLHHLLLLLTWPLGYCLGHILIAMIYYLLLTPLALVFKLLGKTPLALQYPPQASSNFSPLEKSPPTSYYNPF